MAALEAAALWAWPPRELAELHGWRLRAGGALTRRINSAATARFEQGIELAGAIAAVEAWYARRDLPACFQLTPGSEPAGLDPALAARGYRLVTPSEVWTAALDASQGAPGGGIELTPRATQAVRQALFDPRWPMAVRRERAALLARIRRPHRFALAWAGAEPAAAGLVVLDGPLAGLFAVRTQLPFRGRGLAQRITEALLAWAQGQGALWAYLQVEDDNAPARAIYRRRGFTAAYRYWYRES
jgi:GNAT superfamily N-acetyltransferase